MCGSTQQQWLSITPWRRHRWQMPSAQQCWGLQGEPSFLRGKTGLERHKLTVADRNGACCGSPAWLPLCKPWPGLCAAPVHAAHQATAQTQKGFPPPALLYPTDCLNQQQAGVGEACWNLQQMLIYGAVMHYSSFFLSIMQCSGCSLGAHPLHGPFPSLPQAWATMSLNPCACRNSTPMFLFKTLTIKKLLSRWPCAGVHLCSPRGPGRMRSIWKTALQGQEAVSQEHLSAAGSTQLSRHFLWTRSFTKWTLHLSLEQRKRRERYDRQLTDNKWTINGTISAATIFFLAFIYCFFKISVIIIFYENN